MALEVLVMLPGAHTCGDVAPALQDEPSVQGWQSDGAVFPVVPEYVPAAHRSGDTAPIGQKPPGVQTSHAVALKPRWKVPAAQAVHSLAVAFAAIVPAAHGVGEVAPSKQKLPAGQGMHPACEARPVALP